MSLNPDQQAAFEAVKRGDNIFLTGPAGAGKTYLIRHIVEWSASEKKKVAVTALTGCAAMLLGFRAKTLHSWAGIGLGREAVDTLVASIKKTNSVKQRWRGTHILIVDEVSMLTTELFEKLDLIGRLVRQKNAPWGGIQLILCGDYFQLPPVVKGLSGESLSAGRFAFESPKWSEAKLVPVCLKRIERQTDSQFQTILNECRIGCPSAETIAVLETRKGLDWKSQLIRPTLLFSKNADVDAINEKNLSALNKRLFTYTATTLIVSPDSGAECTDPYPTPDDIERCVQRLDNDAPYMTTLTLCVGAQVMLVTNLDVECGLVNGSRGVIVDIRAADNVPIVQFRYGPPIPIEAKSWVSHENARITRTQIPLRVAYAITIHKSQGSTLDCALVDIGSSTFEYGQAYVALSRVRNLESLYIWNLVPSRIRAHPTVVKFYESLETAAAFAPAVPLAAPTAPVVNEPVANELVDAPTTHAVMPTTPTTLDTVWAAVIEAWRHSPQGMKCLSAVESSTAQVYPPKDMRYAALSYAAPCDVKVVILGQDPYHGQHQAHGLSFSVPPGIPLPPSLKNIRKELLSDLALPDSAWPTSHGNLCHWAQQGVLLLNAVLSVEGGKPNSHSGIGWEDLTTALLQVVADSRTTTPLVFVAWGRYAQNVISKLKLKPHHVVISSAHPSPLSAHNGFFGSKPFSAINAALVEGGASPIGWTPMVAEGAC
jgi:ATP-dependent DNA helicase PIF1